MEFALTAIFGVGRSLSKKILEEAKVPLDKSSDELTEGDVSKIREVLERAYKVEGDLRRETTLNIKRLVDLG